MFKKIAVLLLACCWSMGAYAVQIAATVNDEIITDQDVADRVALMEKMFNTPVDDAMKDKLLEVLIDEKVKTITAQQAGIVLSDDEVNEHISFLEAQNQMPAGGLKEFVRQNNLSMDSLQAQFNADLMWLRYVQQQNLKRPTITDKQIDDEINKIKKQLMQPAYLLAEIYIPFDGNETAAEQQAETLFNRIVSGESFTDLALEHSKGKTAAQMGDLGWVKAGQMEKAVDDVLPQIETGQLSRPIKGKDGFTIILMRDNQPALDSDMQEVVQVSQLILSQNDYQSLKEDLQTAQKSCMTFTQFAATHGVEGSHSGALPEMMTARMPADLKHLIKDAPVGQLVGPVDISPYVLFVMKCGSKVMSVLPERKQIEENLQIQAMEKKADELLKDARKELLVEKK